MKNYEVVVIGGGPGGYVAAIRAAKLGCSVALIEDQELGGTCLNRGCIPSKTLLRHAEIIEQIKKANSWGIRTGEIEISLKDMLARKDQVIKRLRSGIAALLKGNKITHYQGFGVVQSDRSVLVRNAAGNETIIAENIILATGSSPLIPAIPGIQDVDIHTSDTIFDIQDIPKSIVIIGGGVIGVEFACIFASLNTNVTIVEMASQILPNEDPDAAQYLHKELARKGITCMVDANVEELYQEEQGKKMITVSLEDGSSKQIISADEIYFTKRSENPIIVNRNYYSYKRT